ncbi:MAG: hypothetical protein RLO12_22750 [Fulvivirga sp.]
MKKLMYLFYGLFFLGFALKFFHIHYTAIMMLIALGSLLILSIVAILKKQPKSSPFLHLTIWSWLVLLLIKIKFFPFGNYALMLACILTAIVLFSVYKTKVWKNLIPISFAMILALTFFLLPSDFSYYILDVKWNYEIESDFRTLDKYSWLLYQNGKTEEALTISNDALKIATQNEDEHWIDLIKNHNLAIREKNWRKYR